MPCAAQWVTHSTCLNDQLEVKVQRIVTARPMSLMGQTRPFDHVRDMSAFPLIATKQRTPRHVGSGPVGDIAPLIRSPRRRSAGGAFAPGAGCCACRGYAKYDAKSPRLPTYPFPWEALKSDKTVVQTRSYLAGMRDFE